MNKKLVLTSFVALGFAMPAMAADPTTASSFPSDGLVQKNMIYTGAAIPTNLAGVESGDVTAKPRYQVYKGYYLPANSFEATLCPAGSFCSGYTTTDADDITVARGITACPSPYTNSVAGSNESSACYRTCSTSDVPNSTGVSGGYYNNNNNQCSATNCASGWHIKEGNNMQNILVSESSAVDNSAYIDNDGVLHATDENSSYYFLTANNTWSVIFAEGSGTYSENSGHNTLIGEARCSTTQGTVSNMEFSTAENIAGQTGQSGARYCYCKATWYVPEGNPRMYALSSPWVFRSDRSSADKCASECAEMCSKVGYAIISGDAASIGFAQTVFSSAHLPNSCARNNYLIKWLGVASVAADVQSNGFLGGYGDNIVGSEVDYGADIRTPTEPVGKDGQKFLGWKFIKPTNN